MPLRAESASSEESPLQSGSYWNQFRFPSSPSPEKITQKSQVRIEAPPIMPLCGCGCTSWLTSFFADHNFGFAIIAMVYQSKIIACKSFCLKLAVMQYYNDFIFMIEFQFCQDIGLPSDKLSKLHNQSNQC